jgi:acetyl esterase/lipase
VKPLSVSLLVAVLVAAPAAGDAAPQTTVPKPRGKSPLRYRDAVFPRVDVARDVPYTTVTMPNGTQTRLTMDRYSPAGDRGRNRPAVVLVHGGGFRAGSKTGQNVVTLAHALAERGYVAASINYRLLARQVCGGPGETPSGCATAAVAAVQDATAAVAFLRDKARRLRIDPRRIAMEGTSAGAVTSQLVGLNGRDAGVRAAIAISGGVPGAAQPGPGAVPTLFFQGTADRTTPYDRAAANVATLDAAGIPVTLETLEGAGHVPFAQYSERFVRHSAYFLYEHLGL